MEVVNAAAAAIRNHRSQDPTSVLWTIFLPSLDIDTTDCHNLIINKIGFFTHSLIA